MRANDVFYIGVILILFLGLFSIIDSDKKNNQTYYLDYAKQACVRIR